ncbi:YhgE/Pip domain-containing protein [Microlunatus elymi]|uniref:YhgE/Pip domain-containing protein n=1 Tax=Microlunatus elymi TaxID=2596828 RepID=A0A516PUT2_9ACTN|nr:YhgE/Pip domain-containing protein [Microlunatus elymi]QDP94947.1 YhgE/Pip domain-containing protein [Microlunatus elymi]
MTNPFRIAAGEFRRFRGPLPKLALVFVTIVPLLYGAIYLAANWDPYGRLSQLPVAIVNQDQPAEAQGRTITAGADFVTELKSEHTFDWHETDEATAQNGLRDGDYYLVVTVPQDFSADLVSGQTDHPERAGIEIRRNDANGFVIGTITSSAQTKIEQAVDQSAVKSYFDVVFENLSKIKTGLNDAADGAGQLDDGLTKAHTGSGKLAKGSSDLATGAQKLETGAATLSSGLDTASTGASELSDGLATMQDKSAKLADGADQVATGTQQLTDTVLPPLTQLQKSLPQLKKNAQSAGTALNDVADAAAGGTQSISDDLGQADTELARLETKYPELKNDPAFGRLSDRVGSASDRANKIAGAARQQADVVSGITDGVQNNITDLSGSITSAKKDLNQLNKGAHQVATGNHQLNTAIATAATGASSLSDGVDKASTGADKLHTGAKGLSDGADQLKTGSHDLDNALGQLSDGAGTLHDQLTTAAKKVPAVTGDQQDQAAQVLSSPAQVTMHVDNPATYYGRGLAPMFFSIALWVFGITAFLILRPFTGRTLLGRGSAFARQLGSWLPAGLLAVLGGLLTIGTIWLFLGLDPVRPMALIAITVLGAAAFSAVAQFLRMTLGTVGSAIMLVWLIVQLASTGGTYPAAVLPQFFARMNPYMPMTYLIDAFRVTISGGETAHLVRDVIVIGSSLVVALGLGTLTMIKKQRLAVGDLHPPLEPA